MHCRDGNLHPSGWNEDKLMDVCLIRQTRHSGPGGQHRNKVQTAIVLVHKPSGLTAFAAERRSQEANRREAIFRLRILLAIGIRTVQSSEVTPSELWQMRCQQQKIVCNERHTDFPTLLAEAIDAIDAKDYDVRRAAAALGCSTSQLVRFLARVPDALTLVNVHRAEKGLHRLQP
jgi:hypothetical protein